MLVPMYCYNDIIKFYSIHVLNKKYYKCKPLTLILEI